MKKVYSLSEARAWFLENATGEVLCVSKSGKAASTCRTYAEAVNFYQTN